MARKQTPPTLVKKTSSFKREPTDIQRAQHFHYLSQLNANFGDTKYQHTWQVLNNWQIYSSQIWSEHCRLPTATKIIHQPALVCILNTAGARMEYGIVQASLKDLFFCSTRILFSKFCWLIFYICSFHSLIQYVPHSTSLKPTTFLHFTIINLRLRCWVKVLVIHNR